MKVKHIMRSRVIAVKPQEEVSTALKIMNENRINGTPVVDDNNKLLGIVVKADIYRFLIAPGHYESCPVDWVMTKDVVTAHPEEDLITAARRLREKMSLHFLW
ncbi:MAG: Acetoin utilization protein AcuB [Clostridia bacterium 41_269]|nr:MAG: Acetoin utilization protein AcuB [Clostridia bacterium 41_269]